MITSLRPGAVEIKELISIVVPLRHRMFQLFQGGEPGCWACPLRLAMKVVVSHISIIIAVLHNRLLRFSPTITVGFRIPLQILVFSVIRLLYSDILLLKMCVLVINLLHNFCSCCLFSLSGFFERKDSVIFERYEMFASTLSEYFRFGHTFSEDVLENYGYKKFVLTVYIHKFCDTCLKED